MRKLIITGLICLIGLHAYGQASLADDTIALGDQTVLTIPVGDTMPSARIDAQVLVLEQAFDTTTHTLRATVTCFDPGEYWLRIGDYDSLRLVVTDVDVDTTSAEIRDIAPIERVPYTFWEIFRWVLLALIVVAIGVAVWWLLTHRQRVQQVLGLGEPADTRTPHQRALDGLEALRDKHLWQAGKAKEYHTELTDIVRRFIEEATGIRATDMTSDETVEALSGKADLTGLRTLFTTADMVKFAKSDPLPHEHEASLTAAIDFVNRLWEQVKPQEEKAKEEKEAAHE